MVLPLRSDRLHGPRAKIAAGAVLCRPETYEILTSASQFAIESLRGLGAKNRSSKEAIMLDVAFVVLGLAVLALMGVYALALRQL